MIISVANQKGGCGKSTTALAIGSYYADKGKRVLFVDTDSSHNMTDVFNVDSAKSISLYDVLLGKIPTEKAIIKTKHGDILPASNKLAAPNFWAQFKADKLKTILEPVKDNYDVVIIDSEPHLGFELSNVLLASDAVVVPVEPEAFSVSGLIEFISTFNAAKAHNLSLKFAGILPTKYNKQSNLHRITLGELEELADKVGTVVFPPIRRSVALAEAARMKQPSIFAYNRTSNGAKDYKEFCERLEQEL